MSSSATLLEQIRQLAAQGQLYAAEALAQQIISTEPDEPEAWSWLGLLASARGNWTEAEAALRQAISRDGKNPHYWSYLSAALRGTGQHQEAENSARQAIELDPRQPTYWTNLALALREQQRWSEAAIAYRQALDIEPASAATWQALAAVEQDAGNNTAAQQAFERALAIAPGGEATIGYAYLLATRGQPTRSIELLRDFLARQPQAATAWMVLAHSFKLTGDFPRAELSCCESIRLDPKPIESYALLAEILLEGKRLAAAEAVARDLVQREPSFGPGWAILGIILSAGAQQDAAAEALRQAVELTGSRNYHSRLLACLQYADGIDPSTLLKEHRAWAATAPGLAIDSTASSSKIRAASGKLRLGFVSADFCEHPIAFLALPALQQLDKNACELVFYSDRVKDDAFTAKFKAVSDAWHFSCGQTDAELAAQVQSDQIGILFDLSGHQGNRLGLFAERAAPTQITWLGYAGTTGVPNMDFILADPHHIRPGEEQYYSEAVLRLPHAYACFDPLIAAPEIAPLPAASGAPFTFGCFNHPAKLTPSVLSAWAEILSRVPASRLLLKFTWLDDRPLQERVLAHFDRRRIDRQRLTFAGAAPRQEMLAAYGSVDLALDTQPYSGGLTTCEALWMGVPVVTWPGRTLAGRHSTCHLTTAGLTQFIASDRESYIDLAVTWSNRIAELAAIRTSLREKMRASPLCNAKQFAADLIRILQTAIK